VALVTKRKPRSIGLLLVLLAMGAFAYVVFASVARFFLGAPGFFLVTAVVVALLIPPYLHVHRVRKKAQKHEILYPPRPEKMPGHMAPSHLEAEVLASFILGGFYGSLPCRGSSGQDPVEPRWLFRPRTLRSRSRAHVGCDGRGSNVVLDEMDRL